MNDLVNILKNIQDLIHINTIFLRAVHYMCQDLPEPQMVKQRS